MSVTNWPPSNELVSGSGDTATMRGGAQYRKVASGAAALVPAGVRTTTSTATSGAGAVADGGTTAVNRSSLSIVNEIASRPPKRTLVAPEKPSPLTKTVTFPAAGPVGGQTDVMTGAATAAVVVVVGGSCAATGWASIAIAAEIASAAAPRRVDTTRLGADTERNTMEPLFIRIGAQPSATAWQRSFGPCTCRGNGWAAPAESCRRPGRVGRRHHHRNPEEQPMNTENGSGVSTETMGQDTPTGTDPAAKYDKPGYEDKSFGQAVEQDQELVEEISDETGSDEEAEERFAEESAGAPALRRQNAAGASPEGGGTGDDPGAGAD